MTSVERREGMRVLAAIVTYNRSQLLARCLDHLEAQDRPVDDIIVVNNSSTDDTEDMLMKRGIAYITQPNLGGAGGFNRAIAYALEQDFDAIWLMDDDGFPSQPALGHLTEAFRADIACVSSVVLREDDRGNFVFPFPKLDRHGLPAVFAWRRKIRSLDRLRKLAPTGTYPFAHLFNGALISMDAVRQIGNVETGFFIFGDEVDYFMRLRGVGQVVSHVDAHHYHPDVTTRPLNDVKIYYYIKNTLILNRRYANWVPVRDALTVGVALARTFARSGLRAGLSTVAGRQSAIVRKAVRRGLDGKVGSDFDA